MKRIIVPFIAAFVLMAGFLVAPPASAVSIDFGSACYAGRVTKKEFRSSVTVGRSRKALERRVGAKGCTRVLTYIKGRKAVVVYYRVGPKSKYAGSVRVTYRWTRGAYRVYGASAEYWRKVTLPA